MSDRLDFYEVREGTTDDWSSVCLCKTLGDAARVIAALDDDTLGNFFVEHIEIVASTTLDVQDY